MGTVLGVLKELNAIGKSTTSTSFVKMLFREYSTLKLMLQIVG